MKALYQNARHQIHSLAAIDPKLPWLLTLDLIVIAIAVWLGVWATA